MSTRPTPLLGTAPAARAGWRLLMIGRSWGNPHCLIDNPSYGYIP